MRRAERSQGDVSLGNGKEIVQQRSRRPRGAYMSEDDAEQALRAMIGWGRYAEAFAYDDERASFRLENPS
jgi:hypothetical protein